MRRISAHRDDAEPPIVDALRRLGATVVLVTAKDAPDLIVGYAGLWALAEVKTGKRKLKPGQKVFAETSKGGWVVELRTVDEAILLLKAMANHSRA